MDIPKIIKEHHQAMIDKGFYDCPECDGDGHYGEQPIQTCGSCNGSRIDPNKNIGELLMLIVTELSEALESHRTNHFCVEHVLDKAIVYQSLNGKYESYYENCVKNTFEDEIADVFLRLFDLCGYLEIEIEEYKKGKEWPIENIADSLLALSGLLSEMRHDPDKKHSDHVYLSLFFSGILSFSSKLGIPIEKHIYAKMAYNKSRPHKHGKEY